MSMFGFKRPPYTGKPLTQTQLANCALEQHCRIKEVCVMCGIKVQMMTFKGTGVCCENHRKDRDNDHAPTQLTVKRTTSDKTNISSNSES